MYLTAAEYAVFAQLPAAALDKTRLSMPPLGVDVFDGALAGLVLAEAEFTDELAMASFVPPPTVVAEVTNDQRLSGGQLATAAREHIAASLREYGIALCPLPACGKLRCTRLPGRDRQAARPSNRRH